MDGRHYSITVGKKQYLKS